MMVGEVYNATPDPGLSASYLGNGKDQLHLAFDFSFFYVKNWRARDYYRVLKNYYEALPADGWPAIVLSNHDQPRARARFKGGKDNIARTQVGLGLLLLVKGTPFLYYGEEIGMTNGRIKRHQLQDPVGIKYWPFHPGRDPERTPMQWSADINAGFSKQTPWLPLAKNWLHENVQSQQKDNDSCLSLTRELIGLRRQYTCLHAGEIDFRSRGEVDNFISFVRYYKKQRMLVHLNFDNQTIELDDATPNIVFSSVGTNATRFLKPYEIRISKLD